MDTGRTESGMDAPTVLVVEDNHELADMYAEWLVEDYAVRVAYGSEQALAEIDASVGVVLLDRRMPDRSGDAVLEEFRERGFDACVAVISAVNPGVDIIGMDVDDYLVKPVTVGELRGTVEDLLERSAYRPDLRELYAVSSKLAVLEETKPSAQLHRRPEYEELTAIFEELRARVDETPRGPDLDDAVVHDVDGLEDAVAGEYR